MFDTMLQLAVSKENDILKYPDQLKTPILNRTIEILSDKDKIMVLVKPINGDRITPGSVDLLYFTAFSSLDFHLSI